MYEATRIKRPLIPSGNTPEKPQEKSRRGDGKPKKPLFVNLPPVSPVKTPVRKAALLTPLRSRPRYIKSPVKYHEWCFEEERALVEFVSISQTDPKYDLDKSVSHWPSFRALHVFWSDAARHIHEATSSNFLLANPRVQERLVNVLRKKFDTLEEAEDIYNLGLSGCLEELTSKLRRETMRNPAPVPKDRTPIQPSCGFLEQLGVSVDKCTQTDGNYGEQLVEWMDEWMLWHVDGYDFSSIDINRPVKGICGFSRETVIAVSTNIESIEFRRRQITTIGYEEHPRAGTIDEVEAFFALVHRFLGNIFTRKQFTFMWRKVVKEFCKRMSLELPFHYWTLNERFTDFHDKMPSFDDGGHDDDDDPPNHPLRLHRLRVNRREDGSVFVPDRSFLPARNQTSIRQRIFRPSAALPPCTDTQFSHKKFACFDR